MSGNVGTLENRILQAPEDTTLGHSDVAFEAVDISSISRATTDIGYRTNVALDTSMRYVDLLQSSFFSEE